MDPLKQKMFEVGAKNLLKTMASDPKTQQDPALAKLVSLAQNFKPGSIQMNISGNGSVIVRFETIDGAKHGAEIA
jgi:hypothetical protein